MIDGSLSKTLGSDRYRVLTLDGCRGCARKASCSRILYINVVSFLSFQWPQLRKYGLRRLMAIQPYRQFAHMNRAKTLMIDWSAIGDVRLLVDRF